MTWKISFCETFSDNQFSLRYPKLEAENHWASLISFLGPPWAMNTKRYEQLHGVFRGMIRQSNSKDVEFYVMRRVINVK